MSTSIVTREVTDRVKQTVLKHGDERLQTRMKQAEELVEVLGQLKGAAMKAGQLLSLEISDLLPPEVSQVLRQLHDRAPPADIKVILEMIEGDLGDKASRLENLSDEPIASASIGQVHSATVDGKKVAVKVQYPGVKGSIDTDLKLLRKLTETALSVSGKKIDLGPFFEALRESLANEVDYRKEAESLIVYKQAIASDIYIVPDVYTELSGEHVLTMSFEEGARINDWLQRDLSQAQRDHFGHLVVQLVLDELFKHGLVQTDPNYGNFLYRQGPGQLVLLDFGATKSYTPEFRERFKKLLILAYNRDREGVLKCLIEYEFLDERESDEVKDILVNMVEHVIATFREENQPFSYNNPQLLETLRSSSADLIKQAKFSPPANEMVFLNRKLGGMFHLLKEARAQINLHEYWLKVVDK